MKKYLISPPFGNIISHSECTSVRGTYTLQSRGSYWKKLYRLLATSRPINGGWINNVGFQNPGIHSVKNFSTDNIYSIGVAGNGEWDELIGIVPAGTAVEINVQCPNLAHHESLSDDLVRVCIEKFNPAIFKLSPPSDKSFQDIDRYLELGVEYIHLFNSLPTERGGESGRRLQKYSLEAIRYVKQKYVKTHIIGGGGIYTRDDLNKYEEAGADYFSLASVFFNPFEARRLLQYL